MKGIITKTDGKLQILYEGKYLPLHPDDESIAIALIGHEINWEFGEGWDDIAKLILPTPVRTIEDIPEELREFYKHIKVSDNPVVNKYFQEQFMIPHDHDYVIALEDFHKWLKTQK